MIRGGFDPGQKYAAVSVIAGDGAPPRLVDAACWVIGSEVPLLAPVKRSDGSIRTHRWTSTEAERQQKADEIAAYIRGHGVERLMVERVDRAFMGDAAGARAAGIATGIKDAERVASIVITKLWGSGIEIVDVNASAARARVCGARIKGEGGRELDPVLRRDVDGWAAWVDGLREADPELAAVVLDHERDAIVVALSDILAEDPAAAAIEAGQRAARTVTEAMRAKRAAYALRAYRKKHGIPLEAPKKGSLSDGSMPWLDRRR